MRNNTILPAGWVCRLCGDEPMIVGGVGHVRTARGPCTERAPAAALAICRAALRATEPGGPVPDHDLMKGQLGLPSDDDEGV